MLIDTQKENFIPEFTEVLTSEGWVEVSKCNFKVPLLTILDNQASYKRPKMFSFYEYKGDLMEVETDSCVIYLKPSTILIVNESPKRIDLVKKGDLLDKHFLYQEVISVKKGEWQGKVYSIKFDIPCVMPIKFEKDYSLLTV